VVPNLRAKGVETFYLEVIQSNEPAVRAYRKAGFEITRELDAFEIQFEDARLDPEAEKGVEIRTIPKSNLTQVEDKEFFDWIPSWENSLSSIQRIPDEVLILGAHVQNKLVGFLVYYPLLNWILNLAVHKSYRRQKIGTSLMAHLKDAIGAQVPSPKIINVEHTDKGMISFLNTVGFKFIINQFEMNKAL
jgi:ribosomal protein S18 acetylase RimI-like enzyme